MLHPAATDFFNLFFKLLLSTILAFLVDAAAVIVTVVSIVPVGVVRHGSADPTHGDIQVVVTSAGKLPRGRSSSFTEQKCVYSSLHVASVFS